MDKEEIRQTITSMLGIIERATFVLHHLHQLEAEAPEPKRYLPKEVHTPQVSEPKPRKQYTKSKTRELTSKVYGIMLARLKHGPARWMELQTEAEKVGYKGRYAVTGGLRHLADRGVVKKNADGLWELTGQ